jgi:hypothetical protein
MREKPTKPDISYKGKKYWIRNVHRYSHYSSEYDNPQNCDSYDILYWDDAKLTGDESVWYDSKFCTKLENKVDRLFGIVKDNYVY